MSEKKIQQAKDRPNQTKLKGELMQKTTQRQGASKMAQQVKAYATKTEDLSFFPQHLPDGTKEQILLSCSLTSYT